MNKSKKWIDINIQPQIKLERFYEIMKEYFKSSKPKKPIKKINKVLEDLIKDEEDPKKVEKELKRKDSKKYSLEDVRDLYM